MKPNINRAVFAALLLSVALPASALAETVTDLAPIQVTGDAEDPTGPVEGYIAATTRTGTKTDAALGEIDQTINVVPAQQIEDQAAQSVAAALRYTPAVFTEYRGTSNLHDEMYIRGFGYVPRYVDGLRFGRASFGQIDPWLLERVEVIKGPASILYGQANPGGIVNLVTKTPTGDSFRRGRLSFGSDNHAALSVDMGGVFEDNPDFSWRVVATGWQTDTVENGLKQNRLAFAPSLTWRPSEDRSLTVSLLSQYEPDAGFRNFREKLGTVDPTLYGLIPREFQVSDPNFQKSERTTNSLALQYEQALGAATTLRSNFRVSQVDSTYQTLTWGSLAADEITISRTGSGGTDDMFEIALDTNIEHRFATGAADHALLVGLDLHRSERDYHWGFDFSVDPIDWTNPAYYLTDADISLTERVSDTDTTTEQAGIYLSDRVEIGRMILSGGLRFDWFDTEVTDTIAATTAKYQDNALTGHLGALYRFDNGIAPYISYSTSFEPVNETPIAGNPPFDPTEGEQVEIGVKWASLDGRYFLQASLFDITQTGVLKYDYAAGGYEQIGEVQSKGFEFEGRMELTEELSLIASYSHVDAEVTQTNSASELGKTPARLPENQAALWAKYEASSGFGIGAGVRYIGESWGDSANSFVVPDVTLFDLALSYEFGARNPRLEGLRAQLNVQNLTDEFYTASCASAYACFVGSGRTVLASVDFAF